MAQLEKMGRNPLMRQSYPHFGHSLIAPLMAALPPLWTSL